MPESNLRAYYVWVPMLPADNETAALTSAKRFSELRAAHYWDGDRRLSHRMARSLRIDNRNGAAPGDDPPFAWDIYLAYGRGNARVWAPDFWMHQLAVDRAPRFDAKEWRLQVKLLTDSSNDSREQ